MGRVVESKMKSVTNEVGHKIEHLLVVKLRFLAIKMYAVFKPMTPKGKIVRFGTHQEKNKRVKIYGSSLESLLNVI